MLRLMFSLMKMTCGSREKSVNIWGLLLGEAQRCPWDTQFRQWQGICPDSLICVPLFKDSVNAPQVLGFFNSLSKGPGKRKRSCGACSAQPPFALFCSSEDNASAAFTRTCGCPMFRVDSPLKTPKRPGVASGGSVD